MKKATSRLVISAVAMLGITATQLEVRVFAQEPRKVNMSVKIPVTLSLPPIAKPAIRWSDRPSAPAAPAGGGGGKKKLIWIAVAGAGGAGLGVYLTHRKETPSITVGNPTIGLQ